MWQQGRAEIDRMLAAGDMERVQASREHAERLMEQARRHLQSAETICAPDPEGAYDTLHDAARKALGAILADQGLRPRPPRRPSGRVSRREGTARSADGPAAAAL